MSKQTIDIPILGIDRRPSQRQSVPGLCDVIENLEPTGPAERPYWKRANFTNIIANDSEIPADLPDKQNIVAAAWHNRSYVGKHGDANGSLKRLVVFLSTGSLRVYDPNLSGGWSLVVSKGYSPNDLTGDYAAEFEQFNNAMVINVSRGGKGLALDLLADDLIVAFQLPECPVIQWSVEGAGRFTDEQITSEAYEGILPGRLFVQYALKLNDGTLVKHTEPEFISLEYSEGAENKLLTYRLLFHHDGYRQLEDPFQGDPALEFWNDEIAGVAVLLGGYTQSEQFISPTSLPGEALEKILFYEVASFPFIDPESDEMSERVISFDDKGDNISTYRLANVDNGSHHANYPATIFSYNSRLMIGNTKTDFARPTTRVNRVIDTAMYLRKFNDQVRIDFLGAASPDDFDIQVTNLQNQETRAIVFSGGNTFANDDAMLKEDSSYVRTNHWRADIINPANNYSVTFTPKAELGRRAPIYSFTSTKLYWESQVIDYKTVPLGEFDLEDPFVVRLGVDIETQSGRYQRVSSGDITLSKRVEPGFDAFFVMQFMNLLSYPDRRAKKMYVWEKDGLNYDLISAFDLKPTQTQNFAFKTEAIPISEEGPDYFDQDVNDVDEVSPNKVQASETNNPFSFLADKVYYIGKSTTNAVTGFAANTLAVSEGQFGQFPLYVFCQDSIWALEQSRDPLVAFASNPPVSLSHGAASRADITNIGRSILFKYNNALFILTGGRFDEVSQPINDYPGGAKINWESVRLATRRRAGVDELLISDGTGVHVFNIEYKRWYALGRSRKFWFNDGGGLYGVDELGDIYNEFSMNNNPVPYRIRLEPVHFGAAEQLKRLSAVYLRGKTRRRSMSVKVGPGFYTTNDAVLYIKGQSAYEFGVEVNGSMDSDEQYIEAITGQVEARYPHRDRVYS